jgi:putative ABC transport system permease protein
VALAEGSFGASAGRGRQRVRRLLVTVQVALALTLLVSSALLARSLWRLMRADAGFEAAGVLTAEIALPRTGYETYAESQRFWEGLIERVRALPGVVDAGMVTGLPLVPQPAYHDLAIEVEERPDVNQPALSVYHATPGYFTALRLRLASGRGFDPADLRAAERPILLSAAAERRLFPGGSAVGKRIRRQIGGEQPWATVIGVVADVPREHVGGAAAEIVYLPVLDEPVDPGQRPFYGTLVVRTRGLPAAQAGAVRGALRGLDPHLPLANVRTMERIVADSASRTSFVMLLLGTAAAAALALGSVGLYAVLSYTVKRRAHEFGIRLALGAARSEVRTMVLRETVRLVAAGIALGVAAAWFSARSLRALLFGVAPGDPVAVVSMVALVLAVSLLAGWLPARRAMRVDPMTVLRRD